MLSTGRSSSFGATGRPVLVVGASGFVGSRLTTGLAQDTTPVLALSRQPLSESITQHPGVIPVRRTAPGDLPEAIRAACARSNVPLPGAIVASIGGWHHGVSLLETDSKEWSSVLASHLTAHFETARALAPLLKPGDPYVVLNGAASRQAMAGSGTVSVTGAGLAMLIQVLRLESQPPHAELSERAPQQAPIRFHELVIDHAITGDHRNMDPEYTRTPDQVLQVLREILENPDTPGVVHV